MTNQEQDYLLRHLIQELEGAQRRVAYLSGTLSTHVNRVHTLEAQLTQLQTAFEETRGAPDEL